MRPYARKTQRCDTHAQQIEHHKDKPVRSSIRGMRRDDAEASRVPMEKCMYQFTYNGA
jgi:hypothetical protein